LVKREPPKHVLEMEQRAKARKDRRDELNKAYAEKQKRADEERKKVEQKREEERLKKIKDEKDAKRQAKLEE
jgi:hypothetical protein